MDIHQLRGRLIPLILTAFFSMLLTILIPSGSGRAQTTPTYITPSEWVNEDITWTKANSPYVLLGDLVLNGATLTIEAGVVVKMAPDAKLTPWYGHLKILGTASDPVILTSLKDDTVAGDTNGDGSSTQPQPGDWHCLCVTGFLTMQHAEIRYAGRRHEASGMVNGTAVLAGSYGANNVISMDYVTITHSVNGIDLVAFGNSTNTLTVTNSLITNNSERGILMRECTSFACAPSGSIRGDILRLSSSSIRNNGIGLHLRGALASFTGNTIEGNATYGILSEIDPIQINAQNNWWGHASGPHHPALNPGGLGDEISGNVNFAPWSTEEGNPPPTTNPGTFISGGISSPTTWTLAGSPYIVSGDVLITSHLTIDKGVVVKMTPGSRFNVWYGKISVLGASDQKVYITSIKDDTVGDDTNGDGDASTPAPGDWQCVCINGIGEFSHTVIRYAGEEIPDGDLGWGGYKYQANRFFPTIYAAGATPLTLNNVTLQYASVGVHAMHRVDAVGISITSSTIEGMSRAGIMAGMWVGYEANNSIFTITDSLFRNNGHGLLLEKATIDIVRSAISGNEVGIEFRGTPGRMYRSMVYGNGTGVVAHSLIDLVENSIFANRDYGINAESMTTNLDARNTWWGHASGPRHASNPSGQGDLVTDRVTYSPVLEFPARTDTNVLELPIGEELIVPVSPMISYYLKVKPELGKNLIIRMDTQRLQSANVTVELFANSNRQPSLWQYDHKIEATGRSPIAQLPLAGVDSGEYYLLLRAPFLQDGSIAVVLNAYYSDLVLTSVSPEQAANQGDLTVTLHGAGFTDSMAVTLISPENNRLSAKNQALYSSSFLQGTFDLNGQPIGFYDLEVKRESDGLTSVLHDAVTVTEGETGRIRLWIEGPPLIRAGRRSTYWLHYKNAGDTNVDKMPFIAVAASRDDTAFITEGYRSYSSAIWLPEKALPPGAEGKIEFDVVARYNTRLMASIVEETDTPFEWAQVSEALSRYDATDTGIIGLQSLLGATQGQVLDSLRSLRTPLGSTQSLNGLLLEALQIADMQYAVSVSSADDVQTDNCDYPRLRFEYPGFVADNVDLFTVRQDGNNIVEEELVIWENFDPTSRTVIITHGWNDCSKNPRLTAIALMLQRWARERGENLNVVTVNWGAIAKSPAVCGFADAIDLLKENPACAVEVSNYLGRVAEEVNIQLEKLQFGNWENTYYIGHSFGNAVNANLAATHLNNGSAVGTALMLNPASRSGFAISMMPNYSRSFARTFAIYTDSIGDIKDYGLAHTSNLLVMHYPDPKCDGDCSDWYGRKPAWRHSTGPFLLACMLKSGPDDFAGLVSADSCEPTTISRLTRAISLIFHDYQELTIDALDPCRTYEINRYGDISLSAERCDTIEDALPGVYPLRALYDIDIEVVGSMDPNDKAGPIGVGENHLVSIDNTLTYVINFENVSSASAPVQELRITDFLNPNLDWSTVRLASVSLGGHIVDLHAQPGMFAFSNRGRLTSDMISGTAEDEFHLDVSSRFNIQTGRLEWYLRMIDTATDDFPADPLAGFLPPEDGTGRGQGYVTFSVKPKPDIPIGTVITNSATIIFDYNAPIETNMVTNTIGEASDLVIQTAAPLSITAGVATTATFTVINDGPNTAREATFTIPAIAGVTSLQLSSPGAVCTTTGCTLGELEAADWREVSVQFLPAINGRTALTGGVASRTYEVNQLNNQAVFLANVDDAPITDLAAFGASVVELGAMSTFTATSRGTNVAYVWDFGDGTSGAGNPVAHAYTAIGWYTVTVTATNSTNMEHAVTTVHVLDTPISGLSATAANSVTVGVPSLFAARISAGTNVAFAWDFGDGAMGVGITTTHTYLSPGIYSLVVTATNSVGQASTSVAITVDPLPTPIPTPTETETATPTVTPTNTPLPTPTNVPTVTPTDTAVPAITPTATSTNTPLPIPTNSPTATPTDTVVPTMTPTTPPKPTEDRGEDFTAFAYELWTSPQSPIQGMPAEVGLIVHHLGGEQSRSVTVNFYRGDPEAGGVLLGSRQTPPLSPNGSDSTLAVSWTPDSTGAVTFYAVIDSDNQFTERDESNNRVNRTVTVLPPRADTTPPTVDRFTINGGALSTAERNVTLSIEASDTGAAASGVSSVFVVEYILNLELGIWMPVQMSNGWLPYAAAVVNPAQPNADYAWQLTDTPGLHYLQVWAADRAGNISTAPRRSYINYTPATVNLAAGAVQVMRYTLQAGERIDIRVQPINGDPDLYLWAPDALSLPRLPWYSNLGGGQVDQLSVVAPVSGVYQLELLGYTVTKFTLDVQITPALAASDVEAAPSGAEPNKAVPAAPFVPLSAQPGDVFVGSSPEPGDDAPENRLYLPAIQR